MSNSIFVITLALSVQIWWSKAFWKAVALAQLVKQFLEVLVSQFARNSMEGVRRAPNKISVAHDLPNHLIHHAESSNLQGREGYGNLSQWAKRNFCQTSTTAKARVDVEQICNYFWVALLWRDVTRLFRVRFRRRLYHWKATIFLLHFKP